MPNHVSYHSNAEAIAPDEHEIHHNPTEGQMLTRQKNAGTHSVFKGKLIVEKNLPTELAQGAFARPGPCEVRVHFAASPGEYSGGPTVRGISIEFLDASRKIAGSRDTGKLVISGHKKTHPMAEEYHSQTPVRYGTTIAKFAIVPSSPGLLALQSHPFSPATPNALREAIIAFFHSNPAEFEFKVQLRGVADGTANYPRENSLYRTVARLVIPAQGSHHAAAENLAFAPAQSAAVILPQEDATSRLAPYSVMSRLRRRKNNRIGRLNILPA